MKGLAQSTQRTYKSGKERYLKFCLQAGLQAVPTCEQVICCFVAHLANEHLKYRTIKVYLAAVRHLHIAVAQPDPFRGTPPMARLEYVLRGIKKNEAEQQQGERERLPITPPLLLQMKAIWEPDGKGRDTKMLWAACCICFFAFLRVGEMTVPSDGGYDSTVHLSLSDVAIDDPTTPSLVRLTIKQSKTDPFRKGVELFIGKASSPLCPVAALLDYLQVRGGEPGPLFKYQDGRALTRARFAAAVRSALHKAGVDQSKYCTHSFRIGAATTAAAKGVEDSVIKTLGRWESLAYLQYVRIPRDQLAGYSQQLVQ